MTDLESLLRGFLRTRPDIYQSLRTDPVYALQVRSMIIALNAIEKAMTAQGIDPQARTAVLRSVIYDSQTTGTDIPQGGRDLHKVWAIILAESSPGVLASLRLTLSEALARGDVAALKIRSAIREIDHAVSLAMRISPEEQI